MSFKKLALVTAMFAATSGVYAMEALDEEALAATTGQDGITVTLTLPAAGITMTQIIHDLDGHLGNANSGAIVIGDPADPTNAVVGGPAPMTIATTGNITLTIDADGGDATPVAAGETGAYLNVNVALSGTTTIHTGDLSVANSGGTLVRGSGFGTVAAAGTSTIMKDLTITLGATSMNIQLGDEPQGAMIKLNTSITNGLDIANMDLADGGGTQTGGSISIANQHLEDAGAGTDLTVAADIDVVAGGLRVALASFGSATGVDARMTGVKLGNAGASVLGDIEIMGLNLNGTAITIAGH